MKNVLVILSVVLVVAIRSVLAAVIVCRSCGWEVESSAAACAHCGVSVAVHAAPDTAGTVEAASVKSKSAPDALIEDAAVDSEIKLCREYSSTGEKELALLILKNAAILNLLSPSAGDQNRSAAIARMLAETDGKGILVDAKCATCGGGGKRIMRTSSIIPGEEGKVREIEGSACPVCKGHGIVRRSGNLDDRKFAMGRAESKFATIQQGRNYRRVGGAWLPAAAAERLNVKQTALVRSASSAPCEKCLGAGRTDCTECNSTGVLDCSNCEAGNVFIKTEGALVKGIISRSEKCKICSGLGVLACEKCSGTGGVLCKQCSGRGDRPECVKCGAMGYADCRKCGGTGSAGESACEACGGEGAVLCSSCKGEGRK